MKSLTSQSNSTRLAPRAFACKAGGLLALLALSATSVFAYTPVRTADILFSVNTDALPSSGAAGNWASYYPSGSTYAQMGGPTVENRNGAKWERNVYANGHGFTIWGAQSGTYTVPLNVPADAPAATQGASIITAVKPVRSGDSGNWRSIVDVMYDQLVLGVANDNGQIVVRRLGSIIWSGSGITIPNGQNTILSLVVTADGKFKVWANGTLVWTYTTGVTFTALAKSGLNATAIGRNNYDGWSTFNGDIGDTFCYTVALSDTDRGTMETALMSKFHAGASYPNVTITASTSGAGSGGAISPSGAVSVPYESDQIFLITKNVGNSLVLNVGGSPVTAPAADMYTAGAALSHYQLSTVTAATTIDANFAVSSTHTVSGSATAAPTGGTTVSFKQSSTALPSFTATTAAGGTYSQTVPDGTWYVCASQDGYMISADQTVVVSGANVTGINFTLTAGRSIPKMQNLLFAADPSTITSAAGAAIASWPTYYPTGTLTPESSPTMQKLSGLKWVQTQWVNNDTSRGFQWATYTWDYNYPKYIDGNGATIVAAVKPVRNTTADRDIIVDIFAENLELGMDNNDGHVYVRLNNAEYRSTATIPDGQVTLLSLVVQPNGTFSVWARPWQTSPTKGFGTAAQVLTSAVVSAMDGFKPNKYVYDHRYINVGREENQYDGHAFNGYINDLFVYKTALSDTDRATLEGDISAKLANVPTYNITSSAGANGSISPLGVTIVGETDSQGYTITPNFGYDIATVLVDGVNNSGAVSSGTYTFTSVTAVHTIAATFTAKTTYAVSGQITDSVSGNPISGAKVYVSTTANASVSPSVVITADASGNYSVNLFNATWYLTVSGTGYTTPSDTSVTVASGPQTVNFALAASGKNIPEMDQLLFSLYGTALTPNGATTQPWPLDHPKGPTAAVINTPTLTTVGGLQWESNRYASGDGYRIGQYSAVIPVTGVTATAVVQPTTGPAGYGWGSIIDVMYSRVVLAIANDTGIIRIDRNGEWQNGPAISSGQKTVLTLVVQPTGQYQVFTNGILAMNITTTSAMNSLDPNWNGGTGFWSYINVGRNNPDGGTVFNGNIGAALLWKTVLSSLERITIESSLGTTFGITMPVYYNITASAGAGGTISPSGVVSVPATSNQTFTVTANVGYTINQVLVDGVNNPAAVSSGTYTFSAVAATHTIAASFTAVPQWTISGKVSNSTGTGIAGATVNFSTTPNAFVSPFATATTDGSGNYTATLYQGSIYVSATVSGYYNSADAPVNLTANTPNVNFALVSSTRNIPSTGTLLFSAVTESLPNSGATGPWATYLPSGQTLTPQNAPTVEIIGGVKWEKNVALTSISPDVWLAQGYQQGTYSTPIPVNGASAVAVVKPTRNAYSTGWTSVIDVFYNRLVIGVNNASGQVIAWRNGIIVNSGSYVIPDGQKTILALVVQPTGEFAVYANNSPVIVNTTTSDMTSLVPNVPGAYASWINVGRNNPDTWTTFNGNIGDVFVYASTLSTTDRKALQSDLATKFGIALAADTTTVAANATSIYNAASQNVSLTATVSSSGAVNVGAVTFTIKDGATVIGTATSGAVNGSGVATISYVLPAGQAAKSYTILASYSNGGISFADSSDSTHTLTITQASTSLAVTSSRNPSGNNESVSFTATVTPSAAGGTVQFKINGQPFGSAVTLSSGQATSAATTSLPHGSSTVTAEYAGNSNFAGSTNSVVQVVNTPPQASDIAMFALTGQPVTMRIIGGKDAPTDADNDSLTVSAIGAAAHGAVTTDGTSVTYTSASNFAGTDTFTYTVSDNWGGAATKTVSVTVTAGGAGFNLLSGPVNNGDGTATISFVAIPGFKYALETTSGLGLPANWTPLVTNTVDSKGQLDFTFSTTAGQGYFRTRYVP